MEYIINVFIYVLLIHTEFGMLVKVNTPAINNCNLSASENVDSNLVLDLI